MHRHSTFKNIHNFKLTQRLETRLMENIVGSVDAFIAQGKLIFDNRI